MARHPMFSRVAVVLAICVGQVTSSFALFLDDNRLFRFTGTFYTQERIRVQSSDGPLTVTGGGTEPAVGVGQLVQLRNFAYPVLEGDLAGALGWNAFLKDLSFRFTGRFVYDGIYDVGPGQFRRGLRAYEGAAQFSLRRDDGTGTLPGPAPLYQGTKPVEALDGTTRPCGSTPPFFSPICLQGNAATRAARIRNQEIFDSRDQFARQAEAWEIYMNVAKGPLFLRIGRQNLSWGEADGQRLLDEINPLNRFFGLPFDEDLDEERIPLWMIRGNVQLVEMFGPLSTFGLEAFWVPGMIDTTQSPFNISGNHPYAPPSGCDPQLIANAAGRANTGGTANPGCRNATGGLLPDGTIKTILYERLPPKNINNSRFGARVVGVLFREYTFSLAGYQTYQDAPVPRVHYLDILDVPSQGSPSNTPPLPTSVVAELVHHKETIIGGTLSFFQPHILPGVVRSEVGYFLNEATTINIANRGFVPNTQEFAMGATPVGTGTNGSALTYVPKADYLRWVLGYDIFQLNVPWLSQTNNIVSINQWFAEINLSGNARERGLLRDHVPPSLNNGDSDPRNADYSLGLAQPNGDVTPVPKFNSLGNNTVQAFMMHGLLVPQITFVWSPQGWFSLLPNVTYRLTDSLLVKIGYSGIYGKFYSGGIFRDRDQVGVRVTYQIS